MSYSNGPQIVTNGLVMYLDAANRKSYPGSGATWYDVSGNGNSATITGNPALSGNHLYFTGSNSATVQYNSSLSFGGANKVGTIEAVGYLPTAASNGVLVYTSQLIVINPTERGYMLCGNYSTTYLGSYMVSTSDTGSVRIGQNIRNIGRPLSPVYCAMVFNGTLVTTYYNTSISTYTWTNADDIAGSMDGRNTVIGGLAAGTDNRDIYVSFVRQYNRALSNEEILQNYNATKTRFGL